MTDELAIKRVAGRPGDEVPFAGGRLRLQGDEAWLLGDATDDAAIQAGEDGPSTHDATAPSVSIAWSGACGCATGRGVGPGASRPDRPSRHCSHADGRHPGRRRPPMVRWTWRRSSRPTVRASSARRDPDPPRRGRRPAARDARGGSAPSPPATDTLGGHGRPDRRAAVIRPRAGAARSARAVGEHRDARATRWPAVPDDRVDRRGARARRAAGRAAGAVIGGRWAGTPAPHDGDAGRAGRRDGLRDVGARGARRRRDPSGRLADGQAPGAGWCRRRAGGGAGVRAVAGPADARPRHRRVARGRHDRHERGAGGGARGGCADRADHRERSITGCRAGRVVVETGELDLDWCHTSVRVAADRGGGTGRPGHAVVGLPARRSVRLADGITAAMRTAPDIAARLGDAAQLLVVASGWTGPPGASSCSSSRRRPGCRRPTATSRRSSTATCPRPDLRRRSSWSSPTRRARERL